MFFPTLCTGSEEAAGPEPPSEMGCSTRVWVHLFYPVGLWRVMLGTWLPVEVWALMVPPWLLPSSQSSLAQHWPGVGGHTADV